MKERWRRKWSAGAKKIWREGTQKKKKVKVNGEGSDAGWRQAGRQGLYYNGTNIRPITATNAPTSARLEKREGQGPENGRERALWYDESSY
uniref:Uncharacterized protein n=1 Tax=Candidozyma auris TaxID=498019 RepID=A0A0L0P200_CANAR